MISLSIKQAKQWRAIQQELQLDNQFSCCGKNGEDPLDSGAIEILSVVAACKVRFKDGSIGAIDIPMNTWRQLDKGD